MVPKAARGELEAHGVRHGGLFTRTESVALEWWNAEEP